MSDIGSADQKREAKAKVLVVDDEPVNVKLLTDLCQKQGYVVVGAYDGDEAITTCQRERPDVVLLDLMMPRMDGLTALRALKADPVTAEIPVIIVSALTDIQGKISGIEIGAFDYVSKPFKIFEVTRRLHAALTLRDMRRRLLDAERALATIKGADALTGAESSAQLGTTLELEVMRARRYNRPLAMGMLAVEAFAALKEKEGREGADAVVASVAQAVRASIRTVDRLFRTDAAEFAVLLPEIDAEGAKGFAARIHAALEQTRPGVGLAIGTAAFPAPEIQSGEDLLRASAKALSGVRKP